MDRGGSSDERDHLGRGKDGTASFNKPHLWFVLALQGNETPG